MHLENKRIVLTGAASGIGRALLERLAAIPGQILAVDLDTEGLAQALSTVTSGPARVLSYSCDVGLPESLEALFDHALSVLGGIDLFFANAGFPYFEKLENPDWDHIQRIFQVNVFSPIYTAVKMRQLNPGRSYRVVITASAMGLLGLPGYALYSSTKAALHRFADSYRFELDDRAALTLVYPIGTRTRFFQSAGKRAAPLTWPSQSANEVAQAILRGVAADRPDIYPSGLFRLFLGLNRLLPFLGRIEQWIELRRFEHWLQ